MRSLLLLTLLVSGAHASDIRELLNQPDYSKIEESQIRDEFFPMNYLDLTTKLGVVHPKCNCGYAFEVTFRKVTKQMTGNQPGRGIDKICRFSDIDLGVAYPPLPIEEFLEKTHCRTVEAEINYR